MKCELIYDILHDIERYVPHNVKETRSKILMPSYRVVTSVDFVLCAIVVLLSVIILLPNTFAYEQEVIDRNGIKKVIVNDLNHNATSVTFEYCFNKYTRDSVGILVTSDLDTVPVPVAPDSIKYGKCAVYGTKILVKSETVNVTLFEQNRIDALISSFNGKVHDLKNNLTQTEQKINQYQKLDYDDNKIQKLERQSSLLEKQIKSAQSGLKTLIVMKNS